MGIGLGKLVPTIATDLDFLEKLGWYFFSIVNKRYDTQLSSDT